jgi:hypothetical protein
MVLFPAPLLPVALEFSLFLDRLSALFSKLFPSLPSRRVILRSCLAFYDSFQTRLTPSHNVLDPQPPVSRMAVSPFCSFNSNELQLLSESPGLWH